MIQRAEAFAKRIQDGNKHESPLTTDQQVQQAFLLALGRVPNARESEAARVLVDEQGLASLCRVLFNTNEFVYVD